MINVSLNEEVDEVSRVDEASRIELNFHRDSKDAEDLEQWLSIPMADIRCEVETFLGSIDVETSEEKQNERHTNA